jgi:hypothetical protein
LEVGTGLVGAGAEVVRAPCVVVGRPEWWERTQKSKPGGSAGCAGNQRRMDGQWTPRHRDVP